MKAAVIRRTRADKIFDTCNAVLMVLLLLITLYPLYFVLIASVSDAYEVAKGNVFAIPKGISRAVDERRSGHMVGVEELPADQKAVSEIRRHGRRKRE